jgi:hypothetical protein
MNQDVANIALMFVLPLGITFITILTAAASEQNMHKLIGAVLSLFIVVMDCLFYFTKNSFISYNADGGLLLAFSSLFFFGILNTVRSELTPIKVANILFSLFMLAAFIGIAYWERPTLLVASDYNPDEIAAQNAKYQDYIASFQNGDGGKWVEAPKAEKDAAPQGEVRTQPKAPMSEASRERLDKYLDECSKVIARMNAIMGAIENFGTIPANISEADREQKSQQALAINNNATALNKKTLGLFHPHESSEAHSEIIQASESIRLAAYSLYTYTLQENAQEQANQYSQCKNQIAQAKASLERFWNDIQNLKTNYQPQQAVN